MNNGCGPTEVLLTAGSPQTQLISLNRWANHPGLRIEFRTRGDDPTNVQVENVFIQLGDGSRVGSGEPNSTYVPVNVPSTTVTTGNYQLEVRLGEAFYESAAFWIAATNQVLRYQRSLGGADHLGCTGRCRPTDGDKFELSDGGTRIVFEFSTDSSVGLGNVPVRFTATDPAYIVARSIRDAINNTSVQSRLKIRAASRGGYDTEALGQDVGINLFGNASLRTISAANAAGEVQVVVHEGFSDRNITRDQAQLLIQNSFIRESRDYGVWSEPAARLQDPRDVVTGSGFFFVGSGRSSRTSQRL